MTEDALLAELRQRETWLRASNELTGALLSGQPGDAALHLVAQRAAEISGAPFVAVVLPEPESGRMVFEVVGAGQRMTVVNSVASKVFSTGEPCVVDDIWATGTEGLPAGLTGLKPALLVPLAAGDTVLGVLVIARVQEPFAQSDLQMVRMFATHAALAIEYARVQEDRQRLAVLEERDRIARDLHDKVIQRLFRIGLGLQGLTRLVARPEVGRRVTALADDLDQTIRDIRRTIFAPQETPRR